MLIICFTFQQEKLMLKVCLWKAFQIFHKIMCENDFDYIFFQSSPPKNSTPAQAYLRAALDHMRSNGIKFHFTPQGRSFPISIVHVTFIMPVYLWYCPFELHSSFQRSVLAQPWCPFCCCPQTVLLQGFWPWPACDLDLCCNKWKGVRWELAPEECAYIPNLFFSG